MKKLLLLPLAVATAVFAAEVKVGNTNGVGAQRFCFGAAGQSTAVQCRDFMPDAGTCGQKVVYITGRSQTDGGVANTDAGPKAVAPPTQNGAVMDFTTIADAYRVKLGPSSNCISVVALDGGPSNCDFFSVYP